MEELTMDDLLGEKRTEPTTYYEGHKSGLGGQTVMKITTNGETTFSSDVLNHFVRHSPDGFNWGYGGSGASDLALSILLDCCGENIAERLYMDFKWEFIAVISDNLLIYQSVIWDWVLKRTGVEDGHS